MTPTVREGVEYKWVAEYAEKRVKTLDDAAKSLDDKATAIIRLAAK
jgi:hypothetical protein